MKWTSKYESWKDYAKRKKTDWERVFAFLPVRVSKTKIAWLETVERRIEQFGGEYTDTLYEYREIGAKESFKEGNDEW